MNNQLEYTAKVGDQLIIWITGMTPIYVAEVTRVVPLEMKVEEEGPFAHLKDGDYFIMEELTDNWQQDGLEMQRFLYSAKKAGHAYLSGLKALGVEDGKLHEILSNKVFAPFTPEQVVYLEIWQRVLPVHPFMCGNEHVGERDLIPSEQGWKCLVCGYEQDWCHAFMCQKPEWHPIENELQYDLHNVLMETLRGIYTDDLVQSLLTLRTETSPRLALLMAEAQNLKQILNDYEMNGSPENTQQTPSSNSKDPSA